MKSLALTVAVLLAACGSETTTPSYGDVRRAGDPSGAGGDTVAGDPMELCLPADATVDTDVVISGRWEDALDLPGLGRPLLEGVEPRAGASFELWLSG